MDERNLKMVAGEVVEFGGDLYGKLTHGYLLPRAWCDIYEWFGGGVAPTKWREAL